jgi:hypothetical protein
MKLDIGYERDRVIFDLHPRHTDICMSPDQAHKVAEEINKAADCCEQWVKTGGSRQLLTGEHVDVNVKSWDGKINASFSRVVDDIPLRYEDAYVLAKLLRAKIPEAENKCTIEWK